MGFRWLPWRRDGSDRLSNPVHSPPRRHPGQLQHHVVPFGPGKVVKEQHNLGLQPHKVHLEFDRVRRQQRRTPCPRGVLVPRDPRGHSRVPLRHHITRWSLSVQNLSNIPAEGAPDECQKQDDVSSNEPRFSGSQSSNVRHVARRRFQTAVAGRQLQHRRERDRLFDKNTMWSF